MTAKEVTLENYEDMKNVIRRLERSAELTDIKERVINSIQLILESARTMPLNDRKFAEYLEEDIELLIKDILGKYFKKLEEKIREHAR